MNKSIAFLLKPASSDCNLFCDYCFYRKTAEDYPETSVHRMSLSTYETLVRKAQDSNRQAISYMWQGGEPMLMGLDFYKKTMEIQEKYRKPNQIISNTIQTNGVAINGDWADFFSKNKFLVGISLDGPKELYDIHRFTRAGTSVFDHVSDACDILSHHEVDYNILAVVNNNTVKYPVEIYRYFLDKRFNFLQFIPCLEVIDQEKAPFSIESEDYGNFLCKLFDAWFENGYPSVNIRFFDNYLQYRVGLVPECCMYKNECGSYFVVEYNGDIFPCDFFVTREWRLGNIHEQSLEDIIDSEKHHEFSALRNLDREECWECRWFEFCQRGCIKFRYLPDMDYSSLSYLCRAYRMFFEHTEERYNFLAWDIMRRRNGLPVPNSIGRNDPCFCGSGKKYKKCCEKYSFILRK